MALASAIARRLPVELFWPFRYGAVALRRGSLPRSACVALLRQAAAARRVAAELPEVRPLDWPSLSFDAVDSMVMDTLFWFGVQGYEGSLTQIWRALCARAGSVLEVGANVGLYAVIGGSACRGDYTVLEPVPEVAATLRRNLGRNGLAGRVAVREAAAVAEPAGGFIELAVPDEDGRAAPVGAFLSVGAEVSGREVERRIRVEAVPFAELAAGRDLIKIDAEGIEYELLTAARPVLRPMRPTLVVEVLPGSVKLAELIRSLAREDGYRIHIVPAFGDQTVVTVGPEAFDARLPDRHRSKDVVLSQGPLPVAAAGRA